MVALLHQCLISKCLSIQTDVLRRRWVRKKTLFTNQNIYIIHLKINTTPSRATYFQAYLSAFECTPSPGGRSHSGYPSFSQPNFQFIGPSGSRFEGICRSRLAFQCGKRFGWLCRRSQISCFRYLPFLLLQVKFIIILAMPSQINAEIMSSLWYGLWKGIKFNCNHYYNNSSQIYMDRLKIFKSIALAAAFLLPTTYAAYKQTEHQLWSFGFNRNGELGLGSENNVSFPQPLKTLMFVDIDTKKSLSAGLTKDGKLYTWGKNRNGNLGHNPPNVNVLIPRQVQFSQRIVQVSCGYQQVCAVTQKGEAFVWGLQQNKSRFRAIGTKESQQESDNKSYKKIQLANVKSVSCSKDYIALVNNEGKVFVVGDTNIKGVNNSQAKNKAELVELEIQKIVKVASGNNYSMALDEQGKVYVWGNNLNGQLGTGGLRNAYQPIFLETLASEKIVDISCGENYSGVVTQKGDVYTWGFGNEGQLGHGDRSDQFVPRKLINLKQKVKKISCGGGHTALVTEGQKVLIVGRGRQGQLGREQKDESSSGYTLLAREVTKLPQKRKIMKVECGQAHTLVLLDTLL